MGRCAGVLARRGEERIAIRAPFTILASGGIGGRYRHSTNFPHLTGDAIDIAKKHGIWVDSESRTSMPGLYAAEDIARRTVQDTLDMAVEKIV